MSEDKLEFTTETGCTVKVVPYRRREWGLDWLAQDSDRAMMIWKMEQPGDGRMVELSLNPDEMVDMRDALNRALLMVAIPRPGEGS